MSITTRVIELDNAGHGSVDVQPAWYVGASGASTVTNDGDDLGTALLTRATSRLAVGVVNVTGAANGEAALYFDF